MAIKLAERILGTLKRLLELEDKVEALAGTVRTLAEETRSLDRRLIRVETTLELATRGAFQPQPENVEFLRRELYHGAFERRLTFNVPVNADGIEATYEMGVLTLRVPKAEAIKPKQIKVQAK